MRIESDPSRALQAPDLDRLPIVAMHHASAFAQHVHRTHARTTRPRIFASRIVSAEPRRFPVAIFLMKRGTSMCVGHAQCRARRNNKGSAFASTTASCGVKAGCRSESSSEFVRQKAAQRCIKSGLHQILVHLRPAVAEKLPRLADFVDLSRSRSAVSTSSLSRDACGNDLAARIAEIAGRRTRRCSRALPCRRD